MRLVLRLFVLVLLVVVVPVVLVMSRSSRSGPLRGGRPPPRYALHRCSIAKGNVMPPYGGKVVTWQLIELA
jgi:hypothetical protein